MRVVENRVQTRDRRTEKKKETKDARWSSAVEDLQPPLIPRAGKKGGGGKKGGVSTT